jgi:hypothetical protein
MISFDLLPCRYIAPVSRSFVSVIHFTYRITMKKSTNYLITEKPTKSWRHGFTDYHFEIITAVTSGQAYYLKKLIHPEVKLLNGMPILHLLTLLDSYYMKQKHYGYITDWTYHISLDKYPGADAIKFGFYKHNNPNYPEKDDDGDFDYSYDIEDCTLMDSLTVVTVYKGEFIFDICLIQDVIETDDLERHILSN